jgi:hypothetical protein
VTEGTTASSGSRARPGVGWIAKGAELVARIGVNPEDGEDLREEGALVPSCGPACGDDGDQIQDDRLGIYKGFQNAGKDCPK